MTPIRCLLRLFLAILCCATAPAQAHKASDSYLSIKTEDRTVTGQWDISVRDLEFAIGLDRDVNGELTWDEIRASHSDIAAYALSRLTLIANDKACPARATEHLIDHHSDGAYAVMRFTAECENPIETLGIHYNLLFDLDRQHKGLLHMESGGQTSTAIFSPENAKQEFGSTQTNRLRQFFDYLKHGVWHIWIGVDHILFLLSLLLPAVLVLHNRQWHSSDSFKASFIDVFKIVTAFTISHSITLSLAAVGAVELPSRWVETAIAASVIIAALNNLFPLFQGKRWVAAFLFGLIHGFGFASVLADLGLPQSALTTALLGFNAGVELGQLAIVMVFLPLAYLLRQTWLYRRIVVNAGSTAIAAIAFVWLIERAFEISLVAI